MGPLFSPFLCVVAIVLAQLVLIQCLTGLLLLLAHDRPL